MRAGPGGGRFPPSGWGWDGRGCRGVGSGGELIVGAYRVRVSGSWVRVSGSGVSARTHDINIFIIDSIIFIDIGV